MHRYTIRLLWALYRHRYPTPQTSWDGASRLIELHAQKDQFWPRTHNKWWVLSEDNETVYGVELHTYGPHCDCPAHKYGTVMCKHVVAVLAWTRWHS